MRGETVVTMTRVWQCILVGTALLIPTAQAEDVLKPQRLTHRTQFFSNPHGSVAFLPQVKVAEEAKYAGQWDLLVESGRYEVDQSDQYCFVVNHRNPAQEGKRSYVAIGAISVLRSGTQPNRPVSLFRNEGWSRSNDNKYGRNNLSPKHLPLTLKMFAKAHNQCDLKENDRLLTHQWHGKYGDEESWADRDIWVHAALDDDKLISSWSRDREQPELRFDAKLIRFAFTEKPNSSRPVAFCLAGDRRMGVVLTVFSPHFNQGERRFELVFR